VAIRIKTLFFIVLGIVILGFLYLERAILAPFILAAIFAYIFNPVVNFFSHKIKIPRIIAVIIIYFFLTVIVVALSIVLTTRIISESSELKAYTQNLIELTKYEVNNLPDWLRPVGDEALSSLEKTKLLSPQSLFSLFPNAISRIVSFFIFIFSGFYFLKDGRQMFDKFLLIVPKKYKIEVEILARKINSVLSAYLRGQLFLVFIVSLMLFAALSILGIRFALILAIFSGFAEIVPIIGPITAAAVAALVAFITASNNFGLSPIYAGAIVIVIYFVVRHFQDYFINPLVLGRITKLHPLVILFAVLAGGHVWGMLGLILAVPIAAVIKILFEFSLDKINVSQEESKPDSV